MDRRAFPAHGAATQQTGAGQQYSADYDLNPQ